MFFLLEQPPAQGPVSAPDSGITQMLIMVAAFVFLFYFIIFRPEHKKRKAEEAKRASLKKGDRITTVGGIVGVVAKVNPETVIVRMCDGARIEFLKAAISDVTPITEEESKKLDREE
jgi:preprotein translocase subunit YajC